MLIGELLRDISGDEEAEALLISTGSLRLIALVKSVSSAEDGNLAEFMTSAARRFANLASQDDWQHMMTRLESAQSPLAGYIECALDWAVSESVTEPSARQGDGSQEACSSCQ